MPNNLNDNEINTILKNYEKYFLKRLKKRLPKNYSLPFKVSEEDFLQEILIKMWSLLKSKYDPSKGSVNTFVTSYIDTVVRYVILNTTKSLYYTGKNSDGKNRRTQIRELQKNTLSIESINKKHSSMSSYGQKSTNTNDNIDNFIYHFSSDVNVDEQSMDCSIDFPIIITEIQKTLPEELFIIFKLYFLEDLSQSEISKKIGIVQSTVSKKIEQIKQEVSVILNDLGY